jgi:hypothetical protein
MLSGTYKKLVSHLGTVPSVPILRSKIGQWDRPQMGHIVLRVTFGGIHAVKCVLQQFGFGFR